MRQEDIIGRIREGYTGMSKGQKRLADYIMNHYDKAVYLTAHRLGEEVGVSESTVVRFATELGYEGYPELQEALEEMVRARLTSIQRIEVAKGWLDKDHLVSAVLQADIENIKATMERIDEQEFRAAIRMLLEAKTVYILGVRSSASLASFLGNYLNLILENVKLIHTNRCCGSDRRIRWSASAFRAIPAGPCGRWNMPRRRALGFWPLPTAISRRCSRWPTSR